LAEPASNLDGSAPDHSPVALLLVDVINDLEFSGGDRLLERALPMAAALARLKQRVKPLGIPAIYVNDNFGRWQTDFRKTVEHVLRDGCPGRPIAELLRPDTDDYFVLKPKHSGFFSTTLDTLLEHLGARTLIITGLTTHICVLFTASDAYMRDFGVLVPADCVASEDPEVERSTLRLMADVVKADTTPSHELDLEAILESASTG
jgi:nicotinamidase-related amidase